jgi:hypothetical protein
MVMVSENSSRLALTTLFSMAYMINLSTSSRGISSLLAKSRYVMTLFYCANLAIYWTFSLCRYSLGLISTSQW